MAEKRETSLTATDIETAEAELWRANSMQGDAAARHALFERYQPIARRIAWRILRDHRTTAEPAELLQLASVGLLEAIDRFQPDLGVPFRYYCTRRITGAVLDGLARLSEVNQQVSTRQRLVRERVRSLQRDEPVPRTLDEQLELLGDVAAELALGLMLEDGALFPEELRDPGRDAYETLAWKQAIQQVMAALEALAPRERAVVRHHYLEAMSFQQIADLLGVTKGRISQLHKSSLRLLRKRISGMGQFRIEA